MDVELNFEVAEAFFVFVYHAIEKKLGKGDWRRGEKREKGKS